MYCENCGAFLPDEAKFCGSCGSKVGEPPAPMPEQSENVANNYGQTQDTVSLAGAVNDPYVGQAQSTQQSSYVQPEPTQSYGQAQPVPPASAQFSSTPPQSAYAQGTNAPYVQQPNQPNNKGKTPIVPIVIGIVAVVVIIIVVVVIFVVKPGSQPSGSAASSGAVSSAAASSAAASSSAASSGAKSGASNEQLLGEWTLAGFETSGVTAAGNLKSVLGFDGKLTLNSDNTGSMAVDNSELTFKWEKAGDSGIKITFDDATAQGAFKGTIDASYSDGELKMALDSNGTSGTLIWSKDGTVKEARDISMDKAKKISSADVLNGTSWILTGASREGVSLYGDSETIASFMPSSMKSTTVKFKKNGTVDFMGEDLTWGINDKGNAYIEENDTRILVKQLDDDIVIDLSKVMGEDMVLLLSKAK